MLLDTLSSHQLGTDEVLVTKIERRRTHDNESDSDEEEVRSYPEKECEMVDVGDLVKNARAKIQDPELSPRSCDSVMSADDSEKSDTTTSSAPEKETNSSPDVTPDTTKEIDKKLQEMESELMRKTNYLLLKVVKMIIFV